MPCILPGASHMYPCPIWYLLPWLEYTNGGQSKRDKAPLLLIQSDPLKAMKIEETVAERQELMSQLFLITLILFSSHQTIKHGIVCSALSPTTHVSIIPACPPGPWQVSEASWKSMYSGPASSEVIWVVARRKPMGRVTSLVCGIKHTDAP